MNISTKKLSSTQKQLERQYKKSFTKFLDVFQKENNKRKKLRPRILEEDQDNYRDGLNLGENNFKVNAGYAAAGIGLLLTEIKAYKDRNSGLFGLRNELHGERMAFESLYNSELARMTDILDISQDKLEDLSAEIETRGPYILKMLQSEADKRSYGL